MFYYCNLTSFPLLEKDAFFSLSHLSPSILPSSASSSSSSLTSSSESTDFSYNYIQSRSQSQTPLTLGDRRYSTTRTTVDISASQILYSVSSYMVLHLKNTSYEHISNLDGRPDILSFHTDCSCFVSYVINHLTLFNPSKSSHSSSTKADKQLSSAASGSDNPWDCVPKDTEKGIVPPSPRAANYYTWFNSLSSFSSSSSVSDSKNTNTSDFIDPICYTLWSHVPNLAVARPGDLLSWTIPGSNGKILILILKIRFHLAAVLYLIELYKIGNRRHRPCHGSRKPT
jgi:hypothetical protein